MHRAVPRGTALARFREGLFDEQKTFAPAGNAKGQRWTPFAQTCLTLADHVKRNPGVTLSEALREVRHHYASHSSGRSALATWLKQDGVRGVEMRRDGKLLRLYPK